MERLRGTYRARRDALVRSLARDLPEGCRATNPGGGFFVWVTLPERCAGDASALLPLAEEAGTSFVPGGVFSVDGSGRRALRLAFSLYGPDELGEAARRLGHAMRRLCEAAAEADRTEEAAAMDARR